MDYAIIFSLMGVTILYLLVKNISLSKSNFINREIIRAVADGELEIHRTEQGLRATIKKEV